MDEAHLSAQRTQTSEDPRLPQADVNQGRASRDPVAPGEGTPTTVRVIAGPRAIPSSVVAVGPIRSRRTFEALRHTPLRGRSGPLTVSFLEQKTWSKTEVAYAINRRTGNAVARNRLRRRMRAIMAEEAPALPVGAYVVSTGPTGPMLDFDELKVAMSQALERATRRRARPSPTAHCGDDGAST
jgi:ribonuclease P protein component